MKLSKSEPADDLQESGSRKRLLVASGVAVGVAAVAGMAFVFLTSGPDDAVSSAPVPPVHSTATVTGTGTTSTTTTAPVIKKFTGKIAHDPFRALVTEAAAGGSATGGAAAGGTVPGGAVPGGAVATTATGPVANPVPSTDVTTPTQSVSSPSASTTKAPQATAAPAVKISMVAVASGDTSARLKVDSKFYTVKPQEEFGTYFRLLNLRESRCGAIQYGDVTFDLCEGQTRTVR